MRILLVRHGESAGNVDKKIHLTVADHAIPLSERGLAQAEESADFTAKFFDENPAEVFGTKAPRLWESPYKRTNQTADPFARKVAILDRRTHILLAEQQFGLFDGLSDEELAIQYPREHAHYTKCEEFEGRFWARMPLGESRFDVCQRVHQAFGTFRRDCDRHGIRDIIVVAHGTTIRAFVMMWLHKPVSWFEAEPNPKNCSVRLLDGDTDHGTIFTPSA